MKKARFIKRLTVCAGLCLIAGKTLFARELSPQSWQFGGPNAGQLSKAVDNDLATVWESGCPQSPGTSILVDLGRSVWVYRVYQTPGAEVSKAPHSLRVSVGETPQTLVPAAPQCDIGPEGLKLYAVSDVRFAPVRGRYVKLEIGDKGAGQAWAIAELEIYGATRAPAAGAAMTVLVDPAVLDPKPGQTLAPLRAAAEDLQMHLMDMLDAPVVLATNVPAGQGLRFRLVVPPPEPAVYPEPDPKDLDDVSVTREGDEIRFGGVTSRAVVYGVYEFLARQGCRWVYPDSHAATVPARKALDLSMLPLRYHPPFGERGFVGDYWEFDVQTPGDNLFALRNGFSFGRVPRSNCGFGRAHTLDRVMGDAVKQHPDWWPGPYRSGSLTPCMSNPELPGYMLQRMDEDAQMRHEKKQPPLQGYSVHPMDAPAFCECERCLKTFGKPQKFREDWEDRNAGGFNYAENHFHLIAALAKRIKAEHPDWFLKTLAYSNHERTPKLIDRLPDNVLVDMCPWWKPLPVASPQHQALRDNLRDWGSKCGSLGIWSYVLIYRDVTYTRPAGEWNALVPNAGAIADQIRFYRDIGVRSLSTQVMGPQHHWPWGFYAWARASWVPDEKSETIEADFFKGYYGEAWEPMLRWYRTLETAAYAQDIGGEFPDPALFTDALATGMRAIGKQAQKAARTWYAKARVAQALYDFEWSFTMARWKTRATAEYPCYRLAAAPAIDGQPDDPAWQTVPECRGFHIAATRVSADDPGRYAFERTTRFRMGWDDRFVYVAAVCDEPEMAKMIEQNKGDTNFVYRNVVELFFAPDAPPFYHQALISAAGFIRGPMKEQGINTDRPAPHPDFAYKTACGDRAWTLEARFPIALVSSNAPRENTRWAANIVRVANLGADSGELYSTWPSLPFFNFHQYPWFNHLVFHDRVLTAADAKAAEAALDADFDRSAVQDRAAQERAAAFAARAQGSENLAASQAKGAHCAGVNQLFARQAEVTWDKGPVEVNAVRIVWRDRKFVQPWYSLEYWDGAAYRLIEERRDNRALISIHEFPAVSAGRLRLILWGDVKQGWHNEPIIKALEAYKL